MRALFALSIIAAVGAANAGAAERWGGRVDPAAVVMAPEGSDVGRCTLAAPCRTLERAQEIARASRRKTIYLRAGTYHRTATLALDARDDGETWMTYPGDPVNGAVLDGSGTVDLIRTPRGRASHITIDGIRFRDPRDIAIELNGDDNRIENCDIGHNHDASEVGGWSPILAVNGRNNRITHNYVHDTWSQGIAAYAYSAGDSIDGTIISDNVVLRAVQHRSDGGAIYIDMRGTNVMGGRVLVSNNYVKDYGGPKAQAEGIYLDDDSSNVTVTGNVIGPPAEGAKPGWGNTMINGGCCNTIAGNIIDLGPSGTQHVSAWSSPGGGGALRFSWTGPNVFRNNIVIAHYAGPTKTALCNPGAGVAYCQGPGYPAEFAVIRNNLYHNYAGGPETTTGAVTADGNPIHRDPEIFGWTYRLARNSPAYRLIDFPRLAGGWGPPGFRLPETGAPPSNPH